MSILYLKRGLLIIFLITLMVLQVSLVNQSAPWLNLVFLFVVIFTAYTLRPSALGVAAFGGFLLEAYATRPTGLLFIALVISVLVMLILNKTVLTHTSGFSLGILVITGAFVFGLGVYLQTLITSAVFLRHGMDVYQPFHLIGFFFLSVTITFILHAAVKGGLDRWMPKTYRFIYGLTG